MTEAVAIAVHEAGPDRWDDFETLMGAKGGSGGCWCMLWRLDRKGFEAAEGEGNRSAMQALFAAGEVPGLLAYDDALPVGWISVAPRGAFPRLAGSRIHRPVDDRPVWSVSCFLVARSHRRRGVSVALLKAAAGFAAARGGTVLEGYPVEPADGRYPAVYAWTGTAAAFRAAGFREVARRSPTRPMMQLDLPGRA